VSDVELRVQASELRVQGQKAPIASLRTRKRRLQGWSCRYRSWRREVGNVQVQSLRLRCYGIGCPRFKVTDCDLERTPRLPSAFLERADLSALWSARPVATFESGEKSPPVTEKGQAEACPSCCPVRGLWFRLTNLSLRCYGCENRHLKSKTVNAGEVVGAAV
jgi:hypothetical protein